MLGRQSNLLKSPLGTMNQAGSSSLLNFNSNSNSSLASSTSVVSSNNNNNATSGHNLNVQSAGNSIDEKSVKDIIQIINKCIDKNKNLTEFSQILQVDNIGLLFI